MKFFSAHTESTRDLIASVRLAFLLKGEKPVFLEFVQKFWYKISYVGGAYYLKDPDQIFFGNAGSGSVYNENGTTTLVRGPLYIFQQRCGTVIIFYGSGSGSYF